MTKDETLKMALEALEKHAELGLLAGATITAIREALALSESSTKCEVSSHAQPQHLADHIGDANKMVEQPEQEPVAWGFQNTAITGSNRWMMLREEIPANDQYGGALWTPLYTTPLQRTWVGLTDEEIWENDSYKVAITDQETRWLYRFARAIEAKLKEKNT